MIKTAIILLRSVSSVMKIEFILSCVTVEVVVWSKLLVVVEIVAEERVLLLLCDFSEASHS